MQPIVKNIKRVTKTVDKYDAEGKLIGREVIVEEYDEYEKQIWEPKILTFPTWEQYSFPVWEQYCYINNNNNLQYSYNN